jgi:exonuclease III
MMNTRGGLLVVVLVTVALIGLVAPQLVDAQVECKTAPSVKQDRRTDKTKLVLAAFNAEWLFLSHRSCPGSGCPWKTVDQAQTHLKNVALVLREVNADMVVIPETQDCGVLTELLNDSQLKSQGYKPYLIKGTDTATGQNVGLITRIDPITNLQRTEERVSYPISGSRCGFQGSSTSAVSKHFFATFNVTGLNKPLLLIGAHLIAFPTTADRCAQREAQATVLRNLAEKEALSKKYEVAMLGDFNDFDPTVNDAAGNVPNSRVFSILKGEELENVAHYHSSGDPISIYSSWYDVNSNCRDDSGPEHGLIDHILLSKGLQNNVKQAWFHHEFTASCSSMLSDHWPVVVEISTTTNDNAAIYGSPEPTADHPTNNGQDDDNIVVLVVAVTLSSLLAAAVILVVIAGTAYVVYRIRMRRHHQQYATLE